MSSQVAVNGEGTDGDALEQCKPIKWLGAPAIDEAYIKALLARMRAAAFREPDLLSLFGMTRACLSKLLSDARNIFARERTLELVDVPRHGNVHILGDLHGDLFSFLSALKITGLPGHDNVLVIAGDLVDRGCWGVEILICVFVLKLWKPKSVFVIRGNHETTGCVTRYGFELEACRKYDLRIYRSFMHTVRELPLAIIVRRRLFESNLPGSSKSTSHSKVRHDSVSVHTSHGSKSRSRSIENSESRSSRSSGSTSSSRTFQRRKVESEQVSLGESELFENDSAGTRRYLVCHGGLWRKHRSRGATTSMTVGSLKDLACEHRQVDDPESSVAEDVLWSDPANPREKSSSGVRSNTLRGAGILYGEGAVDAFFKRENIHGLIRGHEGPDVRRLRPGMDNMCEGYSIDMETPSGFVATVFSAANYPMDCGHGNKGCVATIQGSAAISSLSASRPVFTSFVSTRPTPSTLFYDPMTCDCPHTPR